MTPSRRRNATVRLEGICAALAGKHKRTNPYPRGSQDWTGWCMGFDDVADIIEEYMQNQQSSPKPTLPPPGIIVLVSLAHHEGIHQARYSWNADKWYIFPAPIRSSDKPVVVVEWWPLPTSGTGTRPQ